MLKPLAALESSLAIASPEPESVLVPLDSSLPQRRSVSGAAAGAGVQSWLASVGLAVYWPQFERAGYDSLEVVADLSQADFVTDVGIEKVGHVKKLIKAVRRLQSSSSWCPRSDGAESKGAEPEQVAGPPVRGSRSAEL